MFKGHPKGLIIASIANMGERFGFYTMMAILLLFLQSKFGLDPVGAGQIYSTFYFFIYVLALLGGVIADRFLGLPKTILAGIVLMFLGYLLIALPQSIVTDQSIAYYVVLFGLGIISLGNGLFKGNLQALVGNLYDNPKYSALRDRAFSVFYMCINIGAIFAPHAAILIRNWWLAQNNLGYNHTLPNLCHEMLNGSLVDTTNLETLASKVTGAPVADLMAFASNYLEVFNTGYHFAFAIAAGSMLVSMLIYIFFNKTLTANEITKDDSRTAATTQNTVEKLSWAEEKKRLVALGLVFLIVIFFWMSFHQNGVTMTLFAKECTELNIGPFTQLLFHVASLMGLMAIVGGLSMTLFTRTTKNKLIGGALTLIGAGVCYKYYMDFKTAGEVMTSPELFQTFNPLFVVGLTPVVVGFFSWLNSRGKEPSAPRKIGYGMILAALSFGILAAASFGLTSPMDMANGATANGLASPYVLIFVYFSLTISELFLSPMGISFVSKVAPPRFKGLMQGGWLCATALGNQLLFVGTILWGRIELWQLWLFFVVCCLISSLIIFTLMKKLESVTR